MPDLATKPRRLHAVLSLSLFVSLLAGRTEAGTPPEGHWLTGDGKIAVAIGACEAGSRNLCGIVAGLPGAASDAALARYRSELCGLPVIWDLKAGADEWHWKNGKLLDPETERAHDLEAIFIGRNLELRVFEKGRQTFHRLNWTYVETFKKPCK